MFLAAAATSMAAASPDLDALLAESAAGLARPSANQYAWHEQERTMFVCIGVATCEGTEYDEDGRTTLVSLARRDCIAGSRLKRSSWPNWM